MWDEVRKIVSKAAPLVGSLLGGAPGGAVGSMVASALGVEDDPKAVMAELKRNPDALLKVTQLENSNAEKLQELALEKYKVELNDTQDARQEHGDHWMPAALTMILALMVTLMFISLIWAQIPEAYSQVVIMIVGAVLGAFGTAIAFWLGNSRVSGVKMPAFKRNKK